MNLPTLPEVFREVVVMLCAKDLHPATLLLRRLNPVKSLNCMLPFWLEAAEAVLRLFPEGQQLSLVPFDPAHPQSALRR